MQNSPGAALSTAAMLAIGDELLSGRTKDKNIAYLAEELTKAGIDLREARIIPDDKAEIIAALNALRRRYDYVFVSGGIGPTHDDITAESAAEAFGRRCIFDQRAEAALNAYYRQQNSAMTEGRRLMARMPEGAELIANSLSAAPGFRVENCFMMAGVPQIFQVMAQAALQNLPKSAPQQTVSFICPFGESQISGPLGAIARRFPRIAIGSYPQMADDGEARWKVEIVLRGRDTENLRRAAAAVKKMLADLAGNS